MSGFGLTYGSINPKEQKVKIPTFYIQSHFEQVRWLLSVGSGFRVQYRAWGSEIGFKVRMQGGDLGTLSSPNSRRAFDFSGLVCIVAVHAG